MNFYMKHCISKNLSIYMYIEEEDAFIISL